MKKSLELTFKNRVLVCTVAVVFFIMGLAIYVAMKKYCNDAVFDEINNLSIIILLIISLFTKIKPSEDLSYYVDVSTIILTTIISLNIIEGDTSGFLAFVNYTLTISLPFVSSYIFMNVSINNQLSNLINYINDYKSEKITPDLTSSEYRRLKSSYDRMSDYIFELDESIKKYLGDDYKISLQIRSKEDEKKLRERHNVLLRYYLEKGYRMDFIRGSSGVSKIKISW